MAKKELTKGNVVIGKRYNMDGEYRYIANGDCLFSYAEYAPVSQFCTCVGCGTKLVSWSKNVICPKCNKSCYLI